MIKMFRCVGVLKTRQSAVRSLCAVCLILFFGVGSICAQENVLVLNPQDAVELAVKSNLSLETARINLDTKQRKANLVWNQFLPTVSASGTLARPNEATDVAAGTMVRGVGDTVPFTLPSGDTVDVYPGLIGIATPSMTLPRWNLLGNLQMSLNFSFALIEGINSIKQDYYAGLIGLDKARLQLERDVRKMYNQILLLEENAALLLESYASAQRQAATAEANYRAGLAPRLTWLQAQVAVGNMRPNIDEMENSLKALKGSFAMNLGLPYDTPFLLEPFPVGSFDVPLDLAELISGAVSRKPDIMELRQSIVALQSQRKALALQSYTPFLNFNWTLSSTFNPTLDPFKEDLFTSDNWNKGGQFSITLGYSLNSLLPFTKEGQSLKDLDNTIRTLNINLAQVVMGTELEVFSKLSSLEKTLSTEEAQRASVELAELSYSLTEEAYRAGLQDFQAVQSASLALDQARVQLLTQQFNYINDILDLEYAIGVPFGTLNNERSAR